MWIILNDAYLSIVKPRGDNDNLLVRGRIRGDIERVFPGYKVKLDGGTDYKYRALVPRQVVAATLAERALEIDYTNFKNTVDHGPRHDAYFGIWNIMYRMQERLNPLRRRRGRQMSFISHEDPEDEFRLGY